MRDLLGKKILVFEGAMGTMLQKYGLAVGQIPETLNFSHAEIIEKIHSQYVEAGAEILSTNTFGAFESKLIGTGYTVEDTIEKAVSIARGVKDNNGDKKLFIALDIGPSGEMMTPTGKMTFDEAYEIYKKQVLAGVKAGADLILFETFTDIYEMKAAVIAAKENSQLPVICSLTFEVNGRMLMGSDPLTAINILQDMGIDAIGLNCSLGPRELMPIVRQFALYSHLPIIVQPNAGLPYVEDGKTLYDVTPQEYAELMCEMVELGVSIVGGCCGTTPEYIKELSSRIKSDRDVRKRLIKRFGAASSSTKTVVLDDRVKVIGERINPTGKKLLKEALKAGDFTYIEQEALEQVRKGADILDVNVGLPEIDEKAMMLKAIPIISSITPAPLQIDSSNPEVIEAALRYYNGKAIVNSVNGKESSMSEVFPIVQKYGACVIALTLDDEGLPENRAKRVEIAEKIINRAKEYGIPKERIIVDCLTLTVSAQQEAARETLSAIKELKEKYGIKTTLGASNISFGLPQRKIVNRTFLAMALEAGLDAPITDPYVSDYMETIRSFEVLSGKDVDSREYIEIYGNKPKVENIQVSEIKEEINNDENLKRIILDGQNSLAAQATSKLLESKDPLYIVENIIVPSLELVGKDFESGDIFLPQLIKSADTVREAFVIIKEKMKILEQSISYGKIIVATVKGDIHDIGKNIAKVLLENYGYEVIDLGKDVEIETIVNVAKEKSVDLIGLSALMTTTVANMELTIKALRESGHPCKIMVGGAVLTEDYALKIGADYYCRDAMAGVRAAKEVYG